MNRGSRIKDKVDATSVDTRVSKTKIRESTVRPLCTIALSVLCWVFVGAIFLRNLKKNLGHLSLTEGHIM